MSTENTKIDSYKILHSNSYEGLEKLVNKHLFQGWELRGKLRMMQSNSGFVMSYYQVMVGRNN